MADAEMLGVLVKALEDMDLKMTQLAEDDPTMPGEQWVKAYIVPAGPWHRILGLIRGGLWPGFVEERLDGANSDAPA